MEHVFSHNTYLISTQEMLVFLPVILALVLMPFISRKTVLTLVAFSNVLALVSGIVTLVGIASVAMLFIVMKWASTAQSRGHSAIANVVIFSLCLLFMLHLMPGVFNPLLVESLIISDGAIPYTKHVNFDKAMLAIALLLFIVPTAKRVKAGTLLTVVVTTFFFSTVVFIYATSVQFVNFDPKVSSILPGWALTNLFLTCFAEEAVFRGFIQQKVAEATTDKRWGGAFTVLFSGLFFGLVHVAGGTTYMVLASVMGCAYAYAYQATRNIYVPISMHFLFNLAHFSLFTYPFLQQ